MRIALYGHGQLGVRTARVLLAERGLERLGLVGEEAGHPKVERADELIGYDAGIVVQLDDAGRQVLQEAQELRIEAIVADPLEPDEDLETAVISDATSPAGLAAALAVEIAGDPGEAIETTVSWTESGKVLRRGEPINFPEPIGPRWAAPASFVPSIAHRALRAPGPGVWAGALASVTNATPTGLQTTTLAVVDDVDFLGAILLASAAIAAAEGAYGTGDVWPSDPGGAFLRAARRAGLEAARFVRS